MSTFDSMSSLSIIARVRAVDPAAARLYLEFRNGHELNAADFQELDPIALGNVASFGTATGRQRAFDEISSFLRGRFDWSMDPEAEAECRGAALHEADLDSFGQPTLPTIPDGTRVAPAASDNSHDSTVATTSDTNERYLDSEVVAIYW